jgi:oxygen-dependent protoporphyrinogen oxidase
VRVGGDWLEADRIVIASGAPSASTLLRATPAGELLGQIDHSSATIFVLGFHERDLAASPRGFGFLIPRRERQTILGATWVTNKFPHRAPLGKAIVRCFAAGNLAESAMADVLADFARITGITANPWFTRVYRWPCSMPQYAVGHATTIAKIEAALPDGIYLAGAFLRGVGMPDCARGGRDVSRAVSQSLASETSREHFHASPHSNQRA